MQTKYSIAEVRNLVSEFAKDKQKNPNLHKLSKMMEQIFEEHEETVRQLNVLKREMADEKKQSKKIKTNIATVERDITRLANK